MRNCCCWASWACDSIFGAPAKAGPVVWADTVLAANRPPAATDRPKKFLRSMFFLPLGVRPFAGGRTLDKGPPHHHRGISPSDSACCDATFSFAEPLL